MCIFLTRCAKDTYVFCQFSWFKVGRKLVRTVKITLCIVVYTGDLQNWNVEMC